MDSYATKNTFLNPKYSGFEKQRIIQLQLFILFLALRKKRL